MSYLEHFKLTEQPFRLTPDPDFVYWSKQHARAKAYMESTIWLADGFVVITGEIGSGKTTLLQAFLSEMQEDIVYAVVSQTQLTPTQFLQAVLAEFGFDPFKKRKVELLDMLNMFLIEQYSNGKKVVLIVDEAQNLSKKVLEEIRMLSGIETHKEKVLRIILAGQPELRDKLASPRLKQLLQRVRLRFHIGPLDRREMQEYIEHRLEVAGHEARDLFADGCYDEIQRFTGGVPRLINTLCDTALLCAFAEQKESLDTDDISAAVDELGWHEVSSEPDDSANLPHLVRHQSPIHGKAAIRFENRIISEHMIKEGRVVIGRAPDNEIYIKSKFVSRHHAQLVCDEDGHCVIEDLNSTNGLFIGNKRVKKHVLQDRDVISLGVHELLFTSEAQLAHNDLEDLDELEDDELSEDEFEGDSGDDEDVAANDSSV